MHLPSIAALAGLCALVLAAPPNIGKDLSDKDPMTILKHLNKQALKNVEGVQTDGECTLENATRRKDWYLPTPQRASFAFEELIGA
jgi:hypothetical protein